MLGSLPIIAEVNGINGLSPAGATNSVHYASSSMVD